MIRYTKDTDNIVTLTLDMGDEHKNIINHKKAEAFLPVLTHLKEEKKRHQLKGIIITSAKKNFLSGGQIDYLQEMDDPAHAFELAQKVKSLYRELEQPGVPIVAAINGSALGAGFELALACHHRIVIDDQQIRLGLPEVKIGLMPNSGGVVRLMWLLGVEKAFEVLTNGREYTPKGALAAGMVDALASHQKDMLQQAKEWLLANQGVSRAWDTKDGTILYGNARQPKVAKKVQQLTAGLIKTTQNNYPAPMAILNTLVEGSLVDFDTACRIEGRYFAQLVCGEVSKNMTKAFWYDYNKIKSGVSRPKGFGRFRPRKIGIVGAGRMGSGIAYSCVIRGIEVVLKDISKSVAARGYEYVENRLSKRVGDGKISEAEKAMFLERLTTTDQFSDFEECDLVMEAVFENQNLKSKVIRESEAYMDEYAFLGSNTISIPITRLAASSGRPENIVGLHFFAPADEKRLVEVARGKKTSDETIARAFDFVRAIKKIPIIVKDNWGFFAARVQNTYILEGIAMLQEGYAPALIDNLGVQAGMPKGALALADELSLEIVIKYEEQAAEHYGSKYIQHPAVEVCKNLRTNFSRNGAAKKAGFYDYQHGRKTIWPELTEHYPATKTDYDRAALTERLLFAQIIEAVWCMQEKIVATAPEANLGSIMGWGFPAYTGGVLQYIDNYGVEPFIERCEYFEGQFGRRFMVPPFLRKRKAEIEV